MKTNSILILLVVFVLFFLMQKNGTSTDLKQKVDYILSRFKLASDKEYAIFKSIIPQFSDSEVSTVYSFLKHKEKGTNVPTVVFNDWKGILKKYNIGN